MKKIMWIVAGATSGGCKYDVTGDTGYDTA